MSIVEIKRAGTIALVGRPNAGKSTLLNQILGEKISIISSKPQTTRNRVVGILSQPPAQIILVDTPGIHKSRTRMNQAMVKIAVEALADVDGVCWVVDGIKAVDALQSGRVVVHRGRDHIATLIEQAGDVPVTIAINKVDRLNKHKLLPVMAALSARLPQAEVVPISALKNEGLDTLVDLWSQHVPEGPALFPEDQIMDGSERFVVGELIREKVFRLTEQEVPYCTAVYVEKFDETQREDDIPRVDIYATIVVERPSQKGIVIGKGGSMLKHIGTKARKDIQRLLGCRVHLDLHVKVQDKWTTNPRHLRELGLE
jgi:GTP-binding protein Era